MTPEEQEFHDKWLAIFIELEQETVFGIGFNPRIISQYTPGMVTKCMATYRSRKRFRPTPLFRSLLKWTVGLGAGICVTLATIDKVLETSLPVAASVIVQHEEFKADMSEERNKIIMQLVAAEAEAEAERLKAVKLQEQKEAREEAERKAAEAKKTAKRKAVKAKKVAKRKSAEAKKAAKRKRQQQIEATRAAEAEKAAKDKACSSARSYQCDSVLDNKIHVSVYLKGERIRCTITLNARASDFERCRRAGRRVTSISVWNQTAHIYYPGVYGRSTTKSFPIHSVKAV